MLHEIAHDPLTQKKKYALKKNNTQKFAYIDIIH